jgi:ribosome modulation factor
MADDYRGGCAKGMPVVGACRRDCLHRAMVQEYRDWRTSWEERREHGDHMQMEDQEYAERYPPPTFKAWLVGWRGARQESAA